MNMTMRATSSELIVKHAREIDIVLVVVPVKVISGQLFRKYVAWNH